MSCMYFNVYKKTKISTFWQQRFSQIVNLLKSDSEHIYEGITRQVKTNLWSVEGHYLSSISLLASRPSFPLLFPLFPLANPVPIIFILQFIINRALLQRKQSNAQWFGILLSKYFLGYYWNFADELVHFRVYSWRGDVQLPESRSLMRSSMFTSTNEAIFDRLPHSIAVFSLFYALFPQSL